MYIYIGLTRCIIHSFTLTWRQAAVYPSSFSSCAICNTCIYMYSLIYRYVCKYSIYTYIFRTWRQAAVYPSSFSS